MVILHLSLDFKFLKAPNVIFLTGGVCVGKIQYPISLDVNRLQPDGIITDDNTCVFKL